MVMLGVIERSRWFSTLAARKWFNEEGKGKMRSEGKVELESHPEEMALAWYHHFQGPS
jgi:hypothetical protein